MKEVEYELNSSRPVRRIDAMSKDRKYYTILFLSCLNLILLLSLFFGPPFYHSETVPFDKQKAISNTRKFVIKIGKFNFINDFIALDLILLRPTSNEGQIFSIDSTVSAKSLKGKRYETLYHQPSVPFNFSFPQFNTISNKVRLYSRGIVDFVNLEAEIILKFPTSETYSGLFIVTYNEPAHSLIEALIRIIVFLAGLGCFIYIYNFDKSRANFEHQLHIIQFLIILLIIAADPFFFLSYFTDSITFTLFDETMSIILIVSTTASIMIILDITQMQKKNKIIDNKWIIIESLPFVVTGILYAANEYLTHYMLYNNIEINNNFSFVAILRYIRSAAAAICFIMVVVSMLVFTSPVKMEKIIYVIMILVTFTCCLVFETYGVVEPLIASSHEIQIFTFASISVFILFLTYLYWPVDPDNIVSEDDDMSYDAGDLDLSEEK